MFRQRLQFYRSILLLADVVVLSCAWIAAYYLRFYLPVIPVTKGVAPLELYLTFLPLAITLSMVTFYTMGLYQVRIQSHGQLLWRLVRAETVAFLVLIAATFFFHRQSFSRVVFAYFLVINTMVLPLVRLWLNRVFIKSNAGFTIKTLVVGADELARRTAERLSRRPELGVEVIGFLSVDPTNTETEIGGIPVLGGWRLTGRVIEEYGVGLVLICLPLNFQERMSDVIDLIGDNMVEIKIVPDVYRFTSLRLSVEQFDGLPIISVRESPMHGWNRVVKRGTDIIFACVAIALTWPIMLLAALAVKLTSRGPVFYRQERMGIDGRIFMMSKFRTMKLDAEKETGPVWACQGDDRRTVVGSFLRRFSIDELPQLLHVLKGEMSLVGPRPERPEFIDRFRKEVPKYMLRHKMKAGMTGWAQINGFRGNTSLEGRIKHDLDYIENWSLGLDLKILSRTVWYVLVDRNAY